MRTKTTIAISVALILAAGCRGEADSKPDDGDDLLPTPTTAEITPTLEEAATPTDYPDKTPDCSYVSDAWSCDGSGAFPAGAWALAPAGEHWRRVQGEDLLTWEISAELAGDEEGGAWAGVVTVEAWAVKVDYDDGEAPACVFDIEAEGAPLDTLASCPDCDASHMQTLLDGWAASDGCEISDDDRAYLEAWIVDNLDGELQGYRGCRSVCDGGPLPQVLNIYPDGEEEEGRIGYWPELISEGARHGEE